MEYLTLIAIIGLVLAADAFKSRGAEAALGAVKAQQRMRRR